ncbi:MAG: DUF3108 domain-containing protein [Burkholderiaceae bacterium]|nr:DUF3108 domain-containing protein [Burkholderiaceae bacterium]
MAIPSRSLALPGVKPAGPRWPRRAGWWALAATVVLGHALVTLWLQQNLVDWGDGATPMPQRIEVAFVQALAPAAPPAPPTPAALARARAKPAQARAVAAAASTPRVAAAEPAPEASAPVEALPAPPPAPDSPPAIEALAATAALPAPAPATDAAFEWPPSTRLTYVLSGNYRGEVHGNARVQWVRQGARYQVHLDISIGPSFAPLISRRMSSDGELGEQGLSPRRYDEATRLPFQQARRASLQFTPEQVTLANGSRHEALPGLQDPASQFVQLTWLFTTQPELLRTGNTVTMPLALPRRVGRWVYDVLGRERLATPVGELDTFHLKPRLGERRSGNELSAEVWFAPTLQYLPVRIRIQQDADTFIDLLLDAAPLQAVPADEPTAAR